MKCVDCLRTDSERTASVAEFIFGGRSVCPLHLGLAIRLRETGKNLSTPTTTGEHE